MFGQMTEPEPEEFQARPGTTLEALIARYELSNEILFTNKVEI